jgi:hypothetical protein
MKPQFTPGPWGITFENAAFACVEALESKSIAKVWLQDSDFNRANAQLIAAAPELYEACIAIRDSLCFNKGPASEVITLLTKALDKAHGN